MANLFLYMSFSSTLASCVALSGDFIVRRAPLVAEIDATGRIVHASDEVASAPAHAKVRWTVLSETSACEGNEVERMFGSNGFDLELCKKKCEGSDGCKAIDFFKTTGYCNLFARPCNTPSTVKDEASSWLIGDAASVKEELASMKEQAPVADATAAASPMSVAASPMSVATRSEDSLAEPTCPSYNQLKTCTSSLTMAMKGEEMQSKARACDEIGAYDSCILYAEVNKCMKYRTFTRLASRMRNSLGCKESVYCAHEALSSCLFRMNVLLRQEEDKASLVQRQLRHGDVQNISAPRMGRIETTCTLLAHYERCLLGGGILHCSETVRKEYCIELPDQANGQCDASQERKIVKSLCDQTSDEAH